MRSGHECVRSTPALSLSEQSTSSRDLLGDTFPKLAALGAPWLPAAVIRGAAPRLPRKSNAGARRLGVPAVPRAKMATGRIYVEGNIASGKSTLLRALETEGLLTVPEPVQEFGEELRSLYEKRTRHACVTLEEKVACLCYASQRQSHTRAPATVYERSCFTASDIFGCAYLEAGPPRVEGRTWEPCVPPAWP